MKIVQAHKFYWHRDGASNYMLELSDMLENSGHTVIPFSMKHKKAQKSPYSSFFVSGMDIQSPSSLSFSKKIKYAGRIIYSIEAKKKITKLLQKTNPDIVHLHNIYHHISPSILPAIKKQNIPIVMTLHDYKLICPNYSIFHHGKIHEEDCLGWYTSCTKNKCMKDSYLYSAVAQAEMIFHHKIMRYYERFVDKFIAPSQFMIDMCVKYGWPRDKFVHIPNPVDTTKFALSKKDGEFVSYIGRLSEEKGIEVILDAAKQIPHIPFQIIGTGPLEKNLKTKIQQEKINNIEMCGFQTGKDLQTSYNNARILLAPSVWYENNSLSILEAQAKGKIVIASNIGGIPEMLPKNLLVKPNSPNNLAKSIESWYSASFKKRTKQGEELREDVKKTNNPKNHKKSVEKVYAEVIEKNKK